MKPRRALPRRAAVLLLGAALLVLPASARGNMAEPYTGPVRPGGPAGEPAGGLASVAIERERLGIDLRPLADDLPARVEAVYRVRNDGPARALELVFVAAGLAEGAHGVWLDGRPVASTTAAAGALPPSWRVPRQTPGLEGGAPLPYEAEGEGTIRFRLELPAGRHEVRVRYPAAASVYVDEDELTATQQLAYVLAPARDWAGFGGADVRVELPRGWRAAAEPALRRDGDALVGSWDRVPADALAITVRPPEPWTAAYWGGWILLSALGLYLLLRAGRAFGRALGRRGRGAAWALLPGAALACAWSLAVTLGLAVVPEMVRSAAGPHASSAYGYGLILFGVLLFPALFVAGAAAAQVAAVRARRGAVAPAPEAAPAGAEEPDMETKLTTQTTQPPARWWTGRKKTVAVLGILTLLLIALETGTTGFAFGLVLATLPVPVYVAVALWLDRFEAEPRTLLASAFFWGAAGAVFFSMIVNSVFELSLAGSLGEEAAGLAGSVVSAPVVEELTKALVLFVFFFRHRDEFDNVTDGIVYAAMVGLGFAMTENVLYYGNALAEGTESSVGTFLIRGVMSPFAHPFFTAMTGIGLGIARETQRRPVKALAPLVGLAGAMLLHSLWNLAASLDVFFPVYFLVMVPVFAGVLLLVRRSLRREGEIIRSRLAPLVETGVLAAAELDHMCTVRGRLRASAGTLRRRGVRAWRRHGELHQAVSELAFHRWRVERGISRGAEMDALREGELVSRIGALRDLGTA